MAITEKVIGAIADIGIDVAKEHFKNKRLEAKAKERLSEYLTRQEKYNFDCSLEEEIDFEGLAEYIHNDLIDDVKIRLFGRKQERRIAREAIADKTACYAQAKTKLSKERAKHLAVTAVDILRGFFRSKIDCSTLFAAAEIEDTVTIIRKIDSMRIDNYEKISKKLDALDEGDPIKVPFISSDTDRNIHYSDMFYSDETAREFLGEPTSEVINGAGGENDVSE